jgi:hypothetical protein
VQGAYVNLTADSGLLTTSHAPVEALLAALPAQPLSSAADPEPWAAMLERANEAIVVPTQVRCRMNRCGCQS